MGNYQNQVYAVRWGFLLLLYLITTLDRSQGLYLLPLFYLLKLTVYLAVDTSCNIQHEGHIKDAFNKKHDIYIHDIIHKWKGCDTFRSTYSQYAYIRHKLINQDTQ